MTRKKFIIIMCVIFAVFLTITLNIDIPHKKTVSAEDTKFNQLTDSLFTSMLTTDSLSLHFYLNNPEKYGITEITPSVGSFDYIAMSKLEPYYVSLIKSIKSIDRSRLSYVNQITYDSLIFHFRNEMDFSDYILNYDILSPTTGIQAQLPVLLNQYSFNTSEDVDEYLKMLSTIPAYFRQIAAFEKEKAASGFYMSKSNSDEVIKQCRDFVSDDKNFLITDFKSRLNDAHISNTTAISNYISLNTCAIRDYVIPAYTQLANDLKDISSDNTSVPDSSGLCQYPKGKNYYSYLARCYTGSTLTVHEMENMINAKLKEDIEILLKYSNDATVLAQIQKFDAKGPDAHAIIDELINKSFTDFASPKSLNYTVKEVPASLQDHLSPAFYIVPPIDSPDTNFIYINTPANNSYIDLFSTLAHEGYPGHLYQCTYFAASKPPLIRYLLDFDGYSEGWATYVELYSYRYLFGEGDTANYMSANASFSLGLHTLCDIGVNYHGWTQKDVSACLTKHGVPDTESAAAIYQLVLENPANYLKYYVGYLEILSIKKYFQHELGEDYSDRKFHKYLMEIGPAPFDVIRDNLP